MKFLSALIPILLVGCASIPPEQQMASVCAGIARTYTVAAGYKAEGKLDAATISLFSQAAGVAQILCNKNAPAATAESVATLQAVLDKLSAAELAAASQVKK